MEVGGRRLALSNLEKILYPACGFSKAHVLDYYHRISPFILPHLRGRALTLKRYPDGVEGELFYEKRCPPHRPQWLSTAEVARGADEARRACLVEDAGSLLWVVNLATLELHVPLARAASPETPDSVVFDLDPGEGADVIACARVALVLRDLLSRLGLESAVKTSGQKGLHAYVPLNVPGTSFADTKTFARAVALLLQRTYPALVTARMAKEARVGRVFINWQQNDASKTMICAYSLRAQGEPLVSFPLSWGELERLESEGEPARFATRAADALARVGASGDGFGLMLSKEQRLPHL